jgi:hypothetical protein
MQRPETRELQAAPPEFWTFSCGCFQSPEGRRENSPGLQAWEGLRKESRPESTSSPPRGRSSPSVFRKDCLTRAADFRAYSQKVTFVKSDSMAFQKKNSAGTIRCERDWPIKCNNNIFLRWRTIPVRPPFQGDSVVPVVPWPESIRAWAVLCSPFWWRRHVQTGAGTAMQIPSSKSLSRGR